LASDNTGEGKLATDPIEWLESRQIGRLYLEDLESQGKSIDKRYILYKVSDGMSLKDSFIEWVGLNRRPIITVCRELARLHAELRQTVRHPRRSRWLDEFCRLKDGLRQNCHRANLKPTALIKILLFSDIFLDGFKFKSDSRYCISTSPKTFSREIFAPS
jgi:hypothetical protein